MGSSSQKPHRRGGEGGKEIPRRVNYFTDSITEPRPRQRLTGQEGTIEESWVSLCRFVPNIHKQHPVRMILLRDYSHFQSPWSDFLLITYSFLTSTKAQISTCSS